MNYAYSIPGSQTDPWYFIADDTGVLGVFNKSPDGATPIVVDYSLIAPPLSVLGLTFRVSPGGSPQLGLGEASINDTVNGISFYLWGGNAGQTYRVAINATVNMTIDTTIVYAGVRTDVLTINVLGDGCACAPVTALPASSGAVSGDGALVVNTAVRYFVSATPPVGANVMDQWYDPTTGVFSEFVTDGVSSAWEPMSTISGGSRR